MSDSGLLTMTQGGKGNATLPERRVQAFLYLLLRDYLPSGDVEMLFEMVGDAGVAGSPGFSCPHIEALSGDMARRLLETGSGMSDNEVGQHEDRKATNKEDSHPEDRVKDLSDREREYFRQLDKALDEFRKKATRVIFGKRPIGQGVYYEGSSETNKVRAKAEDGESEFDEDDDEEHTFNAEGIDEYGYDRDGVFRGEATDIKEDGGFLNSSGFPVTEEEVVEQCKATRIEDDDLGVDFFAKGDGSIVRSGEQIVVSFDTKEGGSGSIGGEASAGQTEEADEAITSD